MHQDGQNICDNITEVWHFSAGLGTVHGPLFPCVLSAPVPCIVMNAFKVNLKTPPPSMAAVEI